MATNSTSPAPAVAAVASEPYLVVWQDWRNTDQDIYARAIRQGTLQTTAVTYTYDPLYRLTGAAYTGAISAAFLYQYDLVGNRTAYTRTITSTLVTTYTYNAANQLVTAKLNTSLDTWHYVYDGNGSQVRQVPNGLTPAAGEARFTFDQRNLLTRAELHNGSQYVTQATAGYDGAGNRLQTAIYVAGVPISATYTVDILASSATLLVGDGANNTHVLYGLFGLGEFGTGWSYYLGDAAFSVRQLAADNGAVILARTYDPFGLLLAEAGSSGSIYGFAGTQAGGMGLLYRDGRYFDPRTGRFLSPANNFDPFQPGSLNGYVAAVFLANPAGLLFGPLLILSWRRRKGKKLWPTIWMLAGLSLAIGLAGCQPPRPEPTGTPAATEISIGTTATPQPRTPTAPATATSTSTSTTAATSTATATATATCTPSPTSATLAASPTQPTATIGPNQELTTIEQRIWAVERAVNLYHAEIPTGLVLAIATTESGRNFGWNNTGTPTPDGYPGLRPAVSDDGIMQVTAESGFQGQHGDYTNTPAGIEANIRDGIEVLRHFRSRVLANPGFGDYGDVFDHLSNNSVLVRTTLHYNGGNNPITLYRSGEGGNQYYLGAVSYSLGQEVPATFGDRHANMALANDLAAAHPIVLSLVPDSTPTPSP